MNISIATFFLSLAAIGANACATDDSAPSTSEHVMPDVASAIDAAIAEPEAAAITAAPSGTHLDGDATGYQPRSYLPQTSPRAKDKTIELVLRSSPPGATASIDGKAVGVTPTFWSGKADQRSHEFTFVKEGFSMARYRFVATHSGIVHGSLEALQKNEEASKKR